MKTLFRKLLAVMALLTTLLPVLPAAHAETVSIQARYRPDQTDFMDVNPPYGMCVEYSFFCKQVWKAFGVPLPVEYTKHTIARAPNPRDQFYVAVSPPVEVIITHQQTGDREKLMFSIPTVGQRVFGRMDHHPAWSPFLDGGCTAIGLHPGADFVTTGWIFPGAGACYTSGGLAVGMEGDTQSDEMSAIVRLDTPSPHRMKHGIWRGSVDIDVGNGGYIDFGNQAVVTRGARVTFDIELEVIHAFVIDFAPDSDRAVLEPPGGWAAYEHGGLIPPRLYRVQPFRLWSSGPFKAYIECQHNMGNTCGIQDRRSSHQVPLTIGLTLPPAHTHAGTSVQNVALGVGRANALQFDSAGKSLDRGGSLRYEIAGRDDITQMLKRPGATYTGMVWIVFDAEL
ncbi:hypothetical protein [Pseudomonas sp. dw_358]|uniref:hypothetical protein n=1 Tax=Pseudomonas sp. dw_358 TaxID=2720083 RepID=UPI001BD2423C|nr:hypothetical protein [Pseudomonas sp. dw_358]